MGILKKFFESGAREREKREKFKELEEVEDEESINALKAIWLVSRGNYYGDKGMLDEALEDFKEALQLKPDHLPAHVSRALVYTKRGEMEKVQKLLEEMPEEMKIGGNVVGRKRDMLDSLKDMRDSFTLEWARGVAKEITKSYEIFRGSDPDAPEREILKRVLSARPGYSTKDVGEMVSRGGCKDLFGLCLWVIHMEMEAEVRLVLDASSRQQIRQEISDIIASLPPLPRGRVNPVVDQ
jgi:tetratricopeptide (TPR) repeat protein